MTYPVDVDTDWFTYASTTVGVSATVGVALGILVGVLVGELDGVVVGFMLGGEEVVWVSCSIPANI